MHGSKLIQVLKRLDKEALKDFHTYLKSPFLHGRPGVKKSLALYQIILPTAPDFETSSLDKEAVIKKLYPGTTYKKGKLEKQMSALLGLLQQFIAFQESDQHAELKQLLALVKYYQKHQLPAMVRQCVKKYRQLLSKTPQKDATYYYDVFALEKTIATQQTHFPDPKKELRLPAAMESLDQYYVFEKLEMACLLLSYHRFLTPVEIGKSFDLLEALTPLLEKDYFDVPLIKVYFRAYRLLRADENDSELEYLSFEKALKKYYDQIPDLQLKSLNALIRNYAVMQYHRGLDAYLERVFLLYQEHLERGYLYWEGKLFPATMGNIVIFGARCKQFKWVLKFLESHRDKITGTNNPEVVYNFNLANYYFYTGEYEKVWNHLEQTHDAPHYRLWARRLEIKVYYEQKNELLSSKIDAFKIYVYRLDLKAVPKKQKEGNQHFIDTLKQICLPRTFKNEKRINKLIEKINQLQFVSDKEWLIEKLEELR